MEETEGGSGNHACVIAAHFKNGKTKHFLSEIPQEYKSIRTGPVCKAGDHARAELSTAP
jgi:hypothetical protein